MAVEEKLGGPEIWSESIAPFESLAETVRSVKRGKKEERMNLVENGRTVSRRENWFYFSFALGKARDNA